MIKEKEKKKNSQVHCRLTNINFVGILFDGTPALTGSSGDSIRFRRPLGGTVGANGDMREDEGGELNPESEKLLNPLIKRLPYLFVESLSKEHENGRVAVLREKSFCPKSRHAESEPEYETRINYYLIWFHTGFRWFYYYYYDNEPFIFANFHWTRRFPPFISTINIYFICIEVNRRVIGFVIVLFCFFFFFWLFVWIVFMKILSDNLKKKKKTGVHFFGESQYIQNKSRAKTL